MSWQKDIKQVELKSGQSVVTDCFYQMLCKFFSMKSSQKPPFRFSDLSSNKILYICHVNDWKKRRKKKERKKEIVLRMISWYQGLEETKKPLLWLRYSLPHPSHPSFRRSDKASSECYINSQITNPLQTCSGEICFNFLG